MGEEESKKMSLNPSRAIGLAEMKNLKRKTVYPGVAHHRLHRRLNHNFHQAEFKKTLRY